MPKSDLVADLVKVKFFFKVLVKNAFFIKSFAAPKKAEKFTLNLMRV